MGEVTIRDVARRADVSVASVSRALNGLQYVSNDTRDKVIAAANELGYVPHAGARSLSLARAQAIGVVLPDLHGEFFSEILRGMDREASRLGYLLLLSNCHEEASQATSAVRAMRGRVDGLLVMAPHLDAAVLGQALPSALPALLINSPAVDNRPALRIDNCSAAEAVVQHLVNRGYRRIVHISGPSTNLDAQERKAGYMRAMERLVPEVGPRVIDGDFSEQAGEDAANALLSSGAPFDAVFAANDMMAIACLQSLKVAGIGIPEDVGVAGFDDVPLARYLGLTTVRVGIAELGARAVERLVDCLNGANTESSVEMHGGAIIVRSTTQKTPGGDHFHEEVLPVGTNGTRS